MKILIDTDFNTVTIEGKAEKKEVITLLEKLDKQCYTIVMGGTLPKEVVYIPVYYADPFLSPQTIPAYPTNPYPMPPWGGDVVFANPTPATFTDADGKVWNVSGNNVANSLTK